MFQPKATEFSIQQVVKMHPCTHKAVKVIERASAGFVLVAIWPNFKKKFFSFWFRNWRLELSMPIIVQFKNLD